MQQFPHTSPFFGCPYHGTQNELIFTNNKICLQVSLQKVQFKAFGILAIICFQPIHCAGVHNILHIQIDNLRTEIGAYTTNHPIYTPNIDKLAADPHQKHYPIEIRVMLDSRSGLWWMPKSRQAIFRWSAGIITTTLGHQ
jgi:hypothetical protein